MENKDKNISIKVTVEYYIKDAISEFDFVNDFYEDAFNWYKFISDDFRDSPENFTDNVKVVKVETCK
jgi:hypothetical protein